ncbi:MutS family DNA mismatch repair protein [Gloeobacter violaceus]|uniref:Gll4003 protein n=1 Tax=Gloeobacter violaceus (strain ATCC 29082 / PCC 7421) TaxID=251221 RepID=Q7NE77_GLOVI|nr:MutS family DNA mismatch repair protein [Gloeobacter violaceus]BAC91944.1 gll4003 [Gloeobacter violaceus PCC 7421]
MDLQAEKRSIEAIYQERLERFGAARRLYERRTGRIANARVAVFLIALAFVIVGLADRNAFQPLMLTLAAAGAVGFVGLLVLFGRNERELRRLEALEEENREALARHRRDWQAAPVPETPEFAEQATFARDLDLFGHASLFQLTCTAHTPMGRRLLARWLLEPAGPAAIAGRQRAIADLAPLLDWRQDLAAAGRFLAQKPPDPASFVAWAEAPSWLDQRPWLVWVARLSAAATAALIALQAAEVLSLPLWLGPLTLNIVLSGIYTASIHQTFAAVSNRSGSVRAYAGLFAALSRLECRDETLKSLQAESLNAEDRLRKLDTLVGCSDLRFSQLIYLAVQWITLWDVHVLGLLESWRRQSGDRVRSWLEALAQIEALASLASLAHDQPEWVFAEVDTRLQVIAAGQLGHPLIGEAVRVANDVTLGPPGTFLLVTGSNMSGKSTLLRSIGLNIVLALAGAPVCARSLRLPPVTLKTSMRVQDSLASGLSFYMAELQRLKEVVDAARPAERPLLYLLDEILLGTNSAERQVAVRRVLSFLLGRGALGAISTHDLALADLPELAAAARTVHFREHFAAGAAGPVMTFDYRMRPGVAPTTNALKLLELVGLGDPEDNRPDDRTNV